LGRARVWAAGPFPAGMFMPLSEFPLTPHSPTSQNPPDHRSCPSGAQRRPRSAPSSLALPREPLGHVFVPLGGPAVRFEELKPGMLIRYLSRSSPSGRRSRRECVGRIRVKRVYRAIVGYRRFSAGRYQGPIRREIRDLVVRRLTRSKQIVTDVIFASDVIEVLEVPEGLPNTNAPQPRHPDTPKPRQSVIASETPSRRV